MVITKENFDSEVVKSDIPVLLDFWATWCGPCRMLSPIIEQIADEYAARVKVGKVDVDDQGELASAFGVSSIPTVVLLKGGKVVATSVGYVPKEHITSLIDGNL